MGTEGGLRGFRRGETGEVVVLTGPPGAGKSTVARLIAEDRPLSVHLHSDDFWGFIRNGAIAPYLPEAERQNAVVMDALAAATFAYAAGGYRVILDGVVGPWFLDVFRVAGKARGVPLHYVVLRPDEETTVRRATGRGPGALTEPGPVRSMHQQFAELGDFERHALDSTALGAGDTADAVRRGVADGVFLV